MCKWSAYSLNDFVLNTSLWLNIRSCFHGRCRRYILQHETQTAASIPMCSDRPEAAKQTFFFFREVCFAAWPEARGCGLHYVGHEMASMASLECAGTGRRWVSVTWCFYSSYPQKRRWKSWLCPPASHMLTSPRILFFFCFNISTNPIVWEMSLMCFHLSTSADLLTLGLNSQFPHLSSAASWPSFPGRPACPDISINLALICCRLLLLQTLTCLETVSVTLNLLYSTNVCIWSLNPDTSLWIYLYILFNKGAKGGFSDKYTVTPEQKNIVSGCRNTVVLLSFSIIHSSPD